MTKWEYIKLISDFGDRYGNRGGVNDLLKWCKKFNTNDVTEDEARRFWEKFKSSPPQKM
ncbi:MAG: hypothetical protein RSE64_00435 [Oscillospiraceae bacterium]